jgi:hypothetical protein
METDGKADRMKTLKIRPICTRCESKAGTRNGLFGKLCIDCVKELWAIGESVKLIKVNA